MMIYICDRCKEDILDCTHFHMTFSRNVKVDLCKDCEKSFREWLSGTTEPMKPPTKENEE